MSLNPTEVLVHQARERPENTAFVFKEDVWRYRRLAAEVEHVACGLAARGVKQGDRVALHMTNCPELVVAYYACFRLGAIAAPLRTAFTSAELGPLLQRLRPALYIGQTSLYENVRSLDIESPPQASCILVDAGAPRDRQWNVLRETSLTNLPTPPSDEPAVLLNTSGTTSGRPRFVTHTLNTLAAATDLICKHGGLSADDVVILSLIMVHASGLFRSLALARCGAPFVLLEGFDADAVLDNVEHYRGTCLLGFPAQYAALIKAQRSRSRNLSSLRFCTTGGDACPIELQEQATSTLGAPLYNLWNATEAVGNLAFGLAPGPNMRVVDEAQIRLVDNQEVDVAPGEAGELLIRAPNVFVRYWDDPVATAQTLKNGWYHTGDVMRRGEGNELWFLSRKKDIIIRSGTNISPIEVEEALIACHPAVKAAAVVGKPDPALGQRVVGFITLIEGAGDAVVDEILHNLAKHLAPYKVPEVLTVLETLPLNALSKVDRRRLEAMAREDNNASSID
ncbi:class I adenylate-forming enzyme family protein [Bradyrhizobium sp. Ai1a-2]|uniref:class I adenylate-forming enzyme family protein n=1 Tax=Bradyrhizobium sp. Ai1a-2 TaxID=196490 RepID=UPI0004087E5D|nr:class I adenylate-forming enzyme family protein [Bradyrhizobium sp. Ai1a-2]